MTSAQKKKSKYLYRPLEELNLIDDFLFQELLTQEGDGEEFCRILLSTILGKTIRKVRVVAQKNILGIDTDRHGIRMDAYIEDISEEPEMPGTDVIDAQVMPDIYDLEPNQKYEKHALPKRMRYYHGLIDTQLLASGIDYDNLRNVIIIIILPYDPFDKNRMVYTIQNQCVEDSSVAYDDGAKKIFLYTKGTEGNPSQKLRDMLKYIEETTVDNVTNQDIDTIHQLVNRVKRRKEVGIEYMKSWEHDRIIRDEGWREGKQEGIEQGIIAMIKTCREFGATRELTIVKLIENFGLEESSAEAYMQKNWS